MRFQNTNPERGRKQGKEVGEKPVHEISEHEPRKGTETIIGRIVPIDQRVISEHEPRKGTETLRL